MSNDPDWIRIVARMEVLIEDIGLCNTYASILQALENIEEELKHEIPDFENTAHCKNLEHQQRITEFSMSAVDLNDIYGNAEARKLALERFRDNMKSLEAA